VDPTKSLLRDIYIFMTHFDVWVKCTDKNFPHIYKEIQNGAVAKSYMTNGLLILYMGKYLRISSCIRKPFLIYDVATAPPEFPNIRGKFDFLFYQCVRRNERKRNLPISFVDLLNVLEPICSALFPLALRRGQEWDHLHFRDVHF
jgi:hypothetical protein